MKSIFILVITIFISSCASVNDKKVVDASKDNTPKTLKEKKDHFREMISKHSEFDKGTKRKIEDLMIGAIERTEELRERESQIIQEIMNQTIVKKATFDQMLALKKELKSIYKLKYSNFEKAVKELKEIVGIKPMNQRLSNDLGFEHIFDR